MFVGAFLFPSFICGVAFVINFIAIYYHASRAIPFFTMVRGYHCKMCIVVGLVEVVGIFTCVAMEAVLCFTV